MLRISIIIVNWNTKELLRQCLESLEPSFAHSTSLRATEGKTGEREIIIVDNGSTDGSVELIKNLKFKIKNLKLIQNKENFGFAKGNNIGLKIATGDFVLFLNSDTFLKSGSIELLAEQLSRSPQVGATSPLLLNGDGSIQKDPCYLKFPSPLLAVFYYNRILKNIAMCLFPSLLFSVDDFTKPVFVDQLPGAAIMVRKKVLDKIGSFDEEYGLYFEDADLCMRMKKAGLKLLLNPEVRIVHLGRQSIKPIINSEGIEKFYLLNFQSLFRFCRKHYSFAKALTIKGIVLSQILISGKLRLYKKLIEEGK